MLTLDSICFVHGLGGGGGGRVSTWSRGEVFWPYHLLPKDIKDARVVTWGYKADFAHFFEPTPDLGIKDHARALSNDLSKLRASPEIMKRPVIFAAHSLGGIICAKVGQVNFYLPLETNHRSRAC